MTVGRDKEFMALLFAFLDALVAGVQGALALGFSCHLLLGLLIGFLLGLERDVILVEVLLGGLGLLIVEWVCAACNGAGTD